MVSEDGFNEWRVLWRQRFGPGGVPLNIWDVEWYVNSVLEGVIKAEDALDRTPYDSWRIEQSVTARGPEPPR